MHRRSLLVALALGGLSMRTGAQGTKPAATPRSLDVIRNDWKAFAPTGAQFPPASPALKLSAEEWRKRLTPPQFHVLREEGTERPGSSPLDAEKRRGLFVCSGCDLPVFTSEMKFDSGTGWPSFFTTIPGAFATKTDYILIVPRTEYHCVRCGGHHGHVFDDGPRPTGQRWCNNGLSLKFVAA